KRLGPAGGDLKLQFEFGHAGTPRRPAIRPSARAAVMSRSSHESPGYCHASVIIPKKSAMCDADVSELRFLDRDHSILAFNERVLDWAQRRSVPLLERLRFLTIVSSNLDEFFEVRAAEHVGAALAGEHKGPYTARSFEQLSVAAHRLVERQYALYNDDLM